MTNFSDTFRNAGLHITLSQKASPRERITGWVNGWVPLPPPPPPPPPSPFSPLGFQSLMTIFQHSSVGRVIMVQDLSLDSPGRRLIRGSCTR